MYRGIDSTFFINGLRFLPPNREVLKAESIGDRDWHLFDAYLVKFTRNGKPRKELRKNGTDRCSSVFAISEAQH